MRLLSVYHMAVLLGKFYFLRKISSPKNLPLLFPAESHRP